MRILTLLLVAGLPAVLSGFPGGIPVSGQSTSSQQGGTRAEVRSTAPEAVTTPDAKVSLATARDRMTLLEAVFLSTLDVMHRKYFHGDRAVVPARAMEDVFEDVEANFGIEAHWIAVSLPAMNIDHDPVTAFEREAVRKLKSGQPSLEVVDSGNLRRAVAIPLSGGCLRCHDGSFRSSRSGPAFAGLVMSTPVADAPATPIDAPAGSDRQADPLHGERP